LRHHFQKNPYRANSRKVSAATARNILQDVANTLLHMIIRERPHVV